MSLHSLLSHSQPLGADEQSEVLVQENEYERGGRDLMNINPCKLAPYQLSAINRGICHPINMNSSHHFNYRHAILLHDGAMLFYPCNPTLSGSRSMHACQYIHEVSPLSCYIR